MYWYRHIRSSKLQGISSKLAPKRDGIYEVKRKMGPTTFEMWDPVQNRDIGTVLVSELQHCLVQWRTEREPLVEPSVRPIEPVKGPKRGHKTRKQKSKIPDPDAIEMISLLGNLGKSPETPARDPQLRQGPKKLPCRFMYLHLGESAMHIEKCKEKFRFQSIPQIL